MDETPTCVVLQCIKAVLKNFLHPGQSVGGLNHISVLLSTQWMGQSTNLLQFVTNLADQSGQNTVKHVANTDQKLKTLLLHYIQCSNFHIFQSSSVENLVSIQRIGSIVISCKMLCACYVFNLLFPVIKLSLILNFLHPVLNYRQAQN